jgi:hypothetical protein
VTLTGVVGALEAVPEVVSAGSERLFRRRSAARKGAVANARPNESLRDDHRDGPTHGAQDEALAGRRHSGEPDRIVLPERIASSALATRCASSRGWNQTGVSRY